MKKAKILMVAIVAIISLLAAGCSLGKSNVGVIDLEKIIEQSNKAKDLQKELNKKGEEITKDLAEKKKGATTAQAQEAEKNAYGQYLKEKQRLEAELDKEVDTAIDKVTKAKNIDVVINQKVVRKGGIDITNDVIKELNK